MAKAEDIKVLTPREVADMLRVSERYVQMLASEGRLPAIRVGRYWRFRRERIEAFMNPAPVVAKVEPLRQDDIDARYEELLRPKMRGPKRSRL